MTTSHVATARRVLAAWGLAALVPAHCALASDAVDIRAVYGLPRASLADGQALGWRNVGVVAESEFFDAELNMPSCLPTSAAPATAADRRGVTCSAASDGTGNALRGHHAALTFKPLRPVDGAPSADLTLRSWQAVQGYGTAGERRDGVAAEATLTQSIGSVDGFIGASLPVVPASGGSRWQSRFAGVTWFPARGVRVEFVAERGENPASAAVDRTLTLRVVHAAARGARMTAWATRALDDRADSWQLGAGVDVRF